MAIACWFRKAFDAASKMFIRSSCALFRALFFLLKTARACGFLLCLPNHRFKPAAPLMVFRAPSPPVLRVYGQPLQIAKLHAALTYDVVELARPSIDSLSVRLKPLAGGKVFMSTAADLLQPEVTGAHPSVFSIGTPFLMHMSAEAANLCFNQHRLSPLHSDHPFKSSFSSKPHARAVLRSSSVCSGVDASSSISGKRSSIRQPRVFAIKGSFSNVFAPVPSSSRLYPGTEIDNRVAMSVIEKSLPFLISESRSPNVTFFTPLSA